jgi:hypothetical protein
MARAIPLNETDEEWSASLALIREITRQEQQARDDRMLAARLAGIEIHPELDECRGLAMLLDDQVDDDVDQEDRVTGQTAYYGNI